MDKEQVEDRRLAFGRELREAREARGVSLPALAQATRIRLDFVEALESGEFAKLPGEVFGRGFVRSISRTLGCETGRLIESFDLAWGPSTAPQSVLKVEIKNKPSRSSNDELRIKWANVISILRRGLVFKTIVPLVALLLLLGAGVFGLVRGGVALIGQLKRSTVAIQDGAASEPKKEGSESQPSPSSVAEVPSEDQLSSASLSEDRLGNAGDLSSNSGALLGSTSNRPLVLAIPPATLGGKTSRGPVSAGRESSASDGSLSPQGGDQDSSKVAIFAQPQGDQQVIELVVSEPVRIRLDADQQPSLTKELTPDTYRFTFGSKADLMIYDAAALKVLFNGKSLGSLGHKGRIRRLSFQAEALKTEKKL